jgi:hypothetical protein
LNRRSSLNRPLLLSLPRAVKQSVSLLHCTKMASMLVSAVPRLQRASLNLRSSTLVARQRAFHASPMAAARKPAEKAAAKVETWEVDKTIAPVNIFAGKEDPPILEDDKYPEWLWKINDFEPLEKLEDKMAKGTLEYNNGGKRFFSLKNREKIKLNNTTGGF